MALAYLSGKSPWLYVDFGYWCLTTKSHTGKLKSTSHVYAEFQWKPIKGEDQIAVQSIPFRAFPSQDKAQRDLRACLRDAQREALKMKLPPEVRHRLGDFKIP